MLVVGYQFLCQRLFLCVVRFVDLASSYLQVFLLQNLKSLILYELRKQWFFVYINSRTLTKKNHVTLPFLVFQPLFLFGYMVSFTSHLLITCVQPLLLVDSIIALCANNNNPQRPQLGSPRLFWRQYSGYSSQFRKGC